MTHLCMVHNNVDDASSIGRLAKWGAEVALEAGMRVTVVADRVDRDLAREVEVRPLWVPPRLHLVQWLAARPTIRRAMGGGPYDLVHVHQPQVAALADIWQVHFLSRANADAGGLTPASSLRDRFHRLEQQGVVRAEDHYLTRIPSHTEVVFCSDWLRDQFSRYYPLPANHAVLTNPGPPATPEPDPSDRSTARHHFGLPDEAFVVGFLGGTDPRKGYRELVDRVADEPDVHLLMAGSGSNSFRSPRLGPRLTTTEWLDGPEKDSFFTAIDALAVPSRFDPWPVVVNEAAARGIPVLVSPTTGSCTMVDRERVGLVWDPLREPLGPAISALREHGDEFAVNARRLADRLSFDQQAERLRELYEAAAERRRARPAPS